MKRSKLLRKVQLTGGATYVISLPKDWVKDNAINKGDHLEIIPKADGSLLLATMTGIEKKGAHTEAIMDFSSAVTPQDAAREFVASYLNGYTTLYLKFDERSASFRSHLKDIMRHKLVGVEITEESNEYIVAQCLLGHSEFPVKDALTRMYVMALSMHKDVLQALRKGDQTLANNIALRDDEVDRLYLFLVRQLRKAVQDRFMLEEIGLSSLMECISYLQVAKGIEKIADLASRIAHSIPKIEQLNLNEIFDQTSQMNDISLDICQKAFTAFNDLNIKLANQSIARIVEIVQIEREIIPRLLKTNATIPTIMGLRLILESIRRTAAWGIDIAQTAIDEKNMSKN